MTTQGRINPETLGVFLEGLPDLLEGLRAEGYALGTRQHVAAHELIGSLFARGGLPPKFVELDEWLAPLICFTPAQQEDFRGRYLQWLSAQGLLDDEDLPPGPPPVELNDPPPSPPAPPVGERIVRRVSAYKRSIVITAALLFAAAALFAAYYFGAAYLKDEDLTRVVRLEPPVPDPTPVPIPDDDGGGVVTTTSIEAVGIAWDVEKKAATIPTPTPTPPISLPPPSFFVRHFPTIIALTLTTPFAGFGLWRLLRRLRRRRDAERWRDERPRFDKIKVRGVRERIFQSAALRPVARGLRHYLSVESRQLDARSTVVASARRGGLFTPVYGRRRTLPEYLVLIDRVGFNDQLAQFYSDLVARLGERDVYLDTYYFHGDPRRCREGGPDSPQLSLNDLAARHPDHYLLIFSDGTGLLSTTTGRPEPFVEQLLHWRGRALLTPVPRLEWEYREWALEREGLKVLPATLDGLRLLVDVVNAGARAARAPDFDETPPYPDILREQPALWKEREAPPAHQTRRLVTHLRRYLGLKGFELLCACAVYPVMQWSVTLFFAYELLERREVDVLLPRLLRLPWFRNGTMPQWLRRVLVRELPRARRRLVRERLEHLLLGFLEDPERGVRPHFAEEGTGQENAAPASLLTRLSERLAAWRRSRRLRHRLEQAPARSPLAEPVFLNYVTDNQPAEVLPEPVRHKLFRRGVAAFGLRLAPAAALVTVGVLTGLFLLLLERPDDNIYTPGAPPDLMSSLLAQPSADSTDPDFIYTPTTLTRGAGAIFNVRALISGTYDFTNMRLVPSDARAIVYWTNNPGGGGTNLDEYFRRNLRGAFTARSDAPLGQTALLIYEGDRLRASLPVTITAAGQVTPSPQQQCPKIKIEDDGGIAKPDQPRNFAERFTLISPPAAPSLTYYWSAGAGLSISGQGTRSVNVTGTFEAEAAQLLRVSVGGLPPGCPNVATYNVSDTAINNSTPTPTFNVMVEPQSVTICPSNPKLNEPPDSTVSITVGTAAMVDVTVSDGKMSARGVSRAGYPLYDWDLSGLAPGTYTVTVAPAAAAAQSGTSRRGVTQKVTVKGCAAGTGSIPGLSPDVLSNAAGTLNRLFVQIADMSSLKKALADKGLLAPSEDEAIDNQLTRLRRGVSSLGQNLDNLANNRPAGSSSSLAEQVGVIDTVLKEFESQIANIKDAEARRQLAAHLDAMLKLSSQLNQLRQPLATSTGDE